MPINFTGPNKWRRVFFNTYQGNPENRKIKAPLIEPIELPLLFDQNLLAIKASYYQAPPRWRTSGYLTQVYAGIDLEGSPVTETPASPTYGIDAAKQRIGLNVLEMVYFPRLASDFYLWFDPVHWMPKLTLSLWEFQGTVPQTAVEAGESIRNDLAEISLKIDDIQ